MLIYKPVGKVYQVGKVESLYRKLLHLVVVANSKAKAEAKAKAKLALLHHAKWLLNEDLIAISTSCQLASLHFRLAQSASLIELPP